MKKHAGIGRNGNRRGRRPRRPTVLRERFCRRERGVEDAAPYKMVRYTQGVLWCTIQRQRRWCRDDSMTKQNRESSVNVRQAVLTCTAYSAQGGAGTFGSCWLFCPLFQLMGKVGRRRPFSPRRAKYPHIKRRATLPFFLWLQSMIRSQSSFSTLPTMAMCSSSSCFCSTVEGAPIMISCAFLFMGRRPCAACGG